VKHFEIEQWLDFVLGLRSGAERADMEQHLSSCRQCTPVVEMLLKLRRATTADATCQVPEYVLHSAGTIFALHRPEKVRNLPRLLAKLVFDSFREPEAVGERSQRRMSRQTVFEAGDYSVNLRIGRERDATVVLLVGQIINRRDPDRRMGAIPVVLMSGKDVLGRAISNRFGEFQMEYKAKRSLQLHMPIKESGKRIEVRLGDPSELPGVQKS
jgi:hypothetical protein